jgi:DNA transformation protein and related proteins
VATPNQRRPARRERFRPADAAPRLLNLGPKTTAWLQDAGLHTRDDLARVGAIEACRRMRLAGHPVSLLAAYAIEAGLMNAHWTALPFEFKQQLVIDYRKMERTTPVAPRRP